MGRRFEPCSDHHFNAKNGRVPYGFFNFLNFSREPRCELSIQVFNYLRCVCQKTERISTLAYLSYIQFNANRLLNFEGLHRSRVCSNIFAVNFQVFARALSREEFQRGNELDTGRINECRTIKMVSDVYIGMGR